jgi:hypothetical protein
MRNFLKIGHVSIPIGLYLARGSNCHKNLVFQHAKLTKVAFIKTNVSLSIFYPINFRGFVPLIKMNTFSRGNLKSIFPNREKFLDKSSGD